jgi:hypothetical protein
MGYPVLLGTMVTRCQQRAAREGDLQVESPEYKALISEAYGEIHALVTEKGAWYFRTEATIDLNNLALPSDHLTTIGIDFILNGTTGPRRPVLGPIPPQLRTYFVGLSSGAPAAVWDIEGSSLALYPAPTSGTYKHIYVPQPTDYSTSADTQSIDFINIYGYTYTLWRVASILRDKGSEAQDRAIAEAERSKDQLEYWACLRAITEPSYRVPEDFHTPHFDGVDFWVPPR